MDKPRFEFQRYREFGDIIGDSFTFLIKNLKPLALGFLVFVVPLFLIGALAMLPIMNIVSSEFDDLTTLNPFMSSFASLFFMLATILGSLMLYALVYSLIIAYQEHPDEEMTVSLLWNYMPKAFSKVLIVTLVIFGAMIVVGLLVFAIIGLISPVLGVLIMLPLMFLFIYFMIKFIFTPFIFFSENTDLGESFSRSSFLVQDQWWWTFLLLVVVSMIASLVSYIFVLPATIYMGASSFLSTEPGALMEAPSTTALIIYGVSMIGSLFTNAYAVVGIVLQYYSFREKKEGTSLMDRIEQIGTENSIGFDNEGEY
jgi:MFS family permease